MSQDTPSGAVCPSCGRFVGPLEQCPYCGANVRKRLPLRFLRLACLALAVLGIVVLVYAVSGSPTPTSPIGSVGATMNYAYVRVQGRVTRGPLYDPDARSLRFYIADDTGEIQTVTYRDVVSDLIKQGRIPATGDEISAEGTLRIREDLNTLTIGSADKVQLTPPTPQTVHIGDLSRGDELKYVHISGDVRAISEPYNGLTLITLGDATGEVDVAVNADAVTLFGALPSFQLGDTLDARAVVTIFRDAPQLLLRHPGDLKKLDIENTAATVRKIGALDDSNLNRIVRIAGEVTRVSEFSQGCRATLADDTGEIELVLWQDLFKGLTNPSDLQQGAAVNVIGRLGEFRGSLEIVPSRPADVQISPAVAQVQQTPTALANVHTSNAPTVTPANTPQPTRVPTAAPVMREIGSITAADKDARVIVTGTLTRANPFSQGMRYTLDDGTGSIVLLIWSDVLDKLAIRNVLQSGAQVRVIGKIDVFNDTLEVIPARAEDIELLAAAAGPTVTIRPVQSISTADLDQTVLLDGTITELADFSAGKYVTLRDDSGTIRVTVFRNVLAPVQDQLAIGAKISVRGKVNLFRGKLEIVADEIGF